MIIKFICCIINLAKRCCYGNCIDEKNESKHELGFLIKLQVALNFPSVQQNSYKRSLVLKTGVNDSDVRNRRF